MTASVNPAPRILALGLSEASWPCIRDPSFAPRLAFLAHMESEGARGVTVAPQPLQFQALWATLLTGRSAGGHGVFGSTRCDGNKSFRPTSAKDLAVPPIWQLVEDAGMPVGTFNAVFTEDPSQSATAFMVSTDERREIHPDLVKPETLYPQLIERFGIWTTTTKAQTKAEWVSLVPHEIETRTEVLSDLLRTRPWQFALVHLRETAAAQHRFWNDGTDTLPSVYAHVDRAMAKLVEAAGPETLVFVFSTCGAGPIRYGVHLNTWLEQQGYLHRRGASARRLRNSIARALRSARRLLPRTFNMPGLEMRARAALSALSIDWSLTRAFAPGDDSEIIFTVPAHERDALAHELASRLRLLRDPDGRRVVEDVIPREAWRSCSDFTPDLTVVWEDDAYAPIEAFGEGGRIFGDWCSESIDWPFTSSHRREGMLLVGGPGIEHADLGPVRLVDFVPTWLELLGISIPSELEGSSFAARLFGRP